MWHIIYVWIGLAGVLSFLGVSLLVNHTAFSGAYTLNTKERMVAESMWKNYCSKRLHEIALADVEQDLGRPLDCKWAEDTKSLNVIEKSVADANVWFLVNYSRYHLIKPWTVIGVVSFLFVLSWIVPFLFVAYYFRQRDQRIQLIQKAHQAGPLLKDRVRMPSAIELSR